MLFPPGTLSISGPPRSNLHAAAGRHSSRRHAHPSSPGLRVRGASASRGCRPLLLRESCPWPWYRMASPPISTTCHGLCTPAEVQPPRLSTFFMHWKCAFRGCALRSSKSVSPSRRGGGERCDPGAARCSRYRVGPASRGAAPVRRGQRGRGPRLADGPGAGGARQVVQHSGARRPPPARKLTEPGKYCTRAQPVSSQNLPWETLADPPMY